MEPTLGFDKAWEFTKRWEGGYVNDPKDPGGETKYGISKKAYPNLDIGKLTEDEAKEIYRQDYWEAAKCGELSIDLGVAVFDSAVNCGVTRALRWLDETNDTTDYLKLRQTYYERLVQRNPVMGRFIKGWLNRLRALSAYIQQIG